MRHRWVRVLQRIGVVTAVAVLGLAGAVAVQAPAHAVEPPEGCTAYTGHDEVAGNFIYAYRYWDCDGYQELFPVTIQRYQSPGVWLTVASGTGNATYYCSGSAYNVYRTTGTVQFAILCG